MASPHTCGFVSKFLKVCSLLFWDCFGYRSVANTGLKLSPQDDRFHPWCVGGGLGSCWEALTKTPQTSQIESSEKSVFLALRTCWWLCISSFCFTWPLLSPTKGALLGGLPSAPVALWPGSPQHLSVSRSGGNQVNQSLAQLLIPRGRWAYPGWKPAAHFSRTWVARSSSFPYPLARVS